MNKRMHSSEIRVVVKVVYPILVRAHYIDEFNNLTEVIPQVQHQIFSIQVPFFVRDLDNCQKLDT